MFKLNKNIIWQSFLTFSILELISFFTFDSFILHKLVFIVLALIILGLSIYNLEYGLLIAFGELFVGSMGHLFSFSFTSQILTFNLSIRVFIWLSVMLTFSFRLLFQIIKHGDNAPYYLIWKKFPYRKAFYFLFAAIFFAIINAWGHGHQLSLIFADANAWLYFLLLFPLLAVYGDGKKDRLNRFFNLFLSASLFLSLEILLLLSIFVHHLAISSAVYHWLRKTSLGEMTPTLGGWPRIFMQSQIYSAIAFLAVFWWGKAKFKLSNFWKKDSILLLVLAALFFSSILISFSRSFWLSIFITVTIVLIIDWRKESFGKMMSSASWFVLSVIMSFVLIYLITAFPYLHWSGSEIGQSFVSRVNIVNDNEPALASRWSLLPVITKAIEKEPVFGQGYGKTLTYSSQDPRVLENNKGQYTTYAFEWAYLGIWLKLGLIGLLAYLYLLFNLIKDAFKLGIQENKLLILTLASGLFFLVFTNIFTPYLNHPLGITYLLISSCLIYLNKVY